MRFFVSRSNTHPPRGATVVLLNLFARDDRGVAVLFSTPAARWKILLGLERREEGLLSTLAWRR